MFVTSPFARARKASNVKAATDGNIVPAILEYPEPSTAPLYNLEKELTGVARCARRHHALRAPESIWTLRSMTPQWYVKALMFM